MKKITVFIVLFSLIVNAQNIKKTKFVVMPGDNWMSQNGFLTSVDNQGVSTDVYDYGAALKNNFEMATAVSSIEDVLKERGLQVESMSEKLKGIAKANAENLVNTSKSGASTAQNGFDRLMNTVKPDIVVYVDYQLLTQGPKKTLNLRIEAADAFTFDKIGAKNNSSAPTLSADINTLVRETISSIMDPFMNTIENHVNDIFENGRKVRIEIKKFDSWDGDFEKEYNGQEFKEIIENWFNNIAMKNQYTLDSPSENFMTFDIRIPLFDDTGKATNATSYGRMFQKFLKEPPYSLVAKVREIALGRCMVIIGEK